MGSTSFSVLSTPGTPIVVAAGEEIDFTVEYSPTVPAGLELAVVRIASNDATAPFVDLAASGTLGTPVLATAIANGGNFGNVCLGSFKDEALTINNKGSCPLSIANITSSSPEFIAPGVASYPLVVNSGESLEVRVRFQPTSLGAKVGTLTLQADDPIGSHKVSVSGTAPAPRLVLLAADSGNFGAVCVGSFVDRLLTLANGGSCTLTISSIATSSAEFLAPEVLSYPLTIASGVSLAVPIRFQPTSFGSKSGTMTFVSDDPGGPRTLAISGVAPSGKLAITGSTSFGGVTACCCADRTISICNVGDCKLHVTSVRFKRKSQHWKLLHNPFPEILHAGSCLDVVIRYKATERCPRSCELIIESNDPINPVRIIEVLAYTIWDPCGCQTCCEDCQKGTCGKSHTSHCCHQGYPCCSDDEDDGES